MAHTAQKQQHLDSLQLLLVDANQAYLELTRKMLRFHDPSYGVDCAVNASECLQKAAEKNYDLILLTNDLPGMNGMELLHALHERNVAQPVVLMLEEGQENLALRALEAGALDYVIKNRGYLTALPYTIHKVIERSRLSRRSEETAARRDETRQRLRRGTILLDRRGRFLSANPDAESITAYGNEELLELALTDLMPRDCEWEFFKWLRLVDEQGAASPFKFLLSGKYGNAVPVQLSLTVQKDARREIAGYRGELREDLAALSAKDFSGNGKIDQAKLLDDLLTATSRSYDEPFNVLLSRVIDIFRQRFYFQRAALSMLDRRRGVFVNQVAGGAHADVFKHRKEAMEVPQEVINRIFGGRFRVKVVYSGQNQRAMENGGGLGILERRTQQRRPLSQWHTRDLVLVNLADSHQRSFGYVSLAEPLPGHFPVRDTFYNLEIFGRLVSQFIENYYHYAALERRTRRLKQMLVTNNIFKLELNLGELLREVVWSVKFSLDFDIVALGLISKRSRLLEIRAVAADDKQQALKILGVKIPQDDCAALLKKEYLIGKSYFIDREETALRQLKHIYHRPQIAQPSAEDWPAYGMLMVPIKSVRDKIIGFLMLDHPADQTRPAAETVRLLEMLANQLTVAMENRVLYVEAQTRAASARPVNGKTGPTQNALPSRRMKKFFHKLLG
jgi:PAS domain S-box-containing protein